MIFATGEKMAEYNGWKNYENWNVVLWLNNDEGLYNMAVEFMGDYEGNDPYKDFILYIGLENAKTPDGVSWQRDNVELDDFMRDLITD